MREVRIAARAHGDVRALLKVSREKFGVKASRVYLDLIQRAYALLAENPTRAGVQAHGEKGRFHIRHARQRGVSPKQPRHFIVFTYDDTALTVLRVLHDSMDLPQHVTDNDSET